MTPFATTCNSFANSIVYNPTPLVKILLSRYDKDRRIYIINGRFFRKEQFMANYPTPHIDATPADFAKTCHGKGMKKAPVWGLFDKISGTAPDIPPAGTRCPRQRRTAAGNPAVL